MATECISPLPVKFGLGPSELATQFISPLPVNCNSEPNEVTVVDYKASTTKDDITETVTVTIFYPTNKTDSNGTNFSPTNSVWSTQLEKDMIMSSTPKLVIPVDRHEQSNARAA